MKSCGCGRTHDAEAWSRLKYVGIMALDAREALELRDCACGSTIAVALREDVVANGDRADFAAEYAADAAREALS